MFKRFIALIAVSTILPTTAMARTYDSVGEYGNDGVAVATSSGINYLVDKDGNKLPFSTDKGIVANPNYGMVGIDEGDNTKEWRPTNYYQGECSFYKYTGELVKTIPYEKIVNRYKLEYVPIGFHNGMMFFVENGKVGGWSTDFEVVMQPLYDAVHMFGRSNVLIMSKNGKEGLVDYAGKELTEFKYTIGRYSNGRFLTGEYDGKTDVFDSEGRLLLTTDKEVQNVYLEEELAVTISGNNEGRIGLIDFSGNELLPEVYTHCGKPYNGKIALTNDDNLITYYDYYAKELTDVWFIHTPSDWAIQYMIDAVDVGILPENQRKNFRDNITRLNFCELAYEYIKTNDLSAKGSKKFADTDSKAVSVLADLNVIEGKSQTEFCPDDMLTREEAATILYRIYCLENEVKLDRATAIYDDDNEISEWAYDAVYLMQELGIMTGYEDNRFAPNDNYTKEQAITTLIRMMQQA